jgi:hypothetical protein
MFTTEWFQRSSPMADGLELIALFRRLRGNQVCAKRHLFGRAVAEKA